MPPPPSCFNGKFLGTRPMIPFSSPSPRGALLAANKCLLRLIKWSFIRYPASIHSCHIYSIHLVLQPTCSCHHIQGSFRHVGVRVAMSFRYTRKLTFHGRHIHDELALERTLFQKWFEFCRQNKRSHCIDSQNLQAMRK